MPTISWAIVRCYHQRASICLKKLVAHLPHSLRESDVDSTLGCVGKFDLRADMTSTASLNVTSRVWRGLSKHLRHRFCHTKTSSSKPWWAREKWPSQLPHCLLEPLIVTSQLGPVATVGINRPEKRNCVNRATALELISALRRFDDDDSVVAMVLHGVGGNFCAGYDLEELSQVGQTPIDQLLSNQNGPMVRKLWYNRTIETFTQRLMALGFLCQRGHHECWRRNL